MADENEEVQELTDEEIFEQHRAEIDERFEEKNFFRRVADMFAGLREPKTSREYKLARIELQRLAAPLVAILLPVVGVIVLIVVTAVSGQVEEHVTVDIAQIQNDDAPLEDTPDPPEEEIDMTQDIDVTVDVSTEVPTPDMANPAPPSPDPGGEPDKVAAAPSPVTMSAVSGTVKMRGLGDGTSGGFGTLIGNGGKAQNLDGCLIGILIDFKRDSSGKDISCNESTYISNIGDLTKANFSAAALSKFYVLPKKVALTHVYIPKQPAENGPKAFGVEKLMQAKWWIAYYSGTLKPAEKAKYRFVGYFDEAMIVKINGKVVYESYWGRGPQAGKNEPGVYTGWKPSDPGSIGKMGSGHDGAKLVPGDWFETTAGTKMNIDIVVGEGPGGKCGGFLLIQKEGESGTSIFASRPLSMKEKENLKAAGFGIDSPKMNGRTGAKEAADKMKKDDVSVQVDI